MMMFHKSLNLYIFFPGALLPTAKKKGDARIVAALEGSDAVAKEVHYHLSCYKSYCKESSQG